MFSSLHCYQFIKSSQVCTSDTRIYFAVKLPDGVVLDKTIVDQVRLHHTDKWCAPDLDSHDAFSQQQ